MTPDELARLYADHRAEAHRKATIAPPIVIEFEGDTLVFTCLDCGKELGRMDLSPEIKPDGSVKP